MDDFELRMERAALEGAASGKPTLEPFIDEAVAAAKAELAAATTEPNKNPTCL
jgi:hypothetical protein